MTNAALNTALDAVYTSLNNDNEELDTRIQSLKTVMQAQNIASAEIDPAKLPQPNRQGRKMLQSYFKKRGVAVHFTEVKA